MEKRLLFLLVIALFTAINVNAQIMKTDELEVFAKDNYGDNWQEIAKKLSSQLTLDKNKFLTYEKIIDCGESTKEQLYTILNYWFTSTFNDANSVIQLNDKELGTIIARGRVSGIAEHRGGLNHYSINISPMIKVDIKDKKIRITYTIQNYEVEKDHTKGIVSRMAGERPSDVSYEKMEFRYMLSFCAKRQA